MIISDEVKEALGLDNNNASAFEVLGISRDANFKETRKSFKRLAAIYHPDKNGGNPIATEIFQAINQAYQEIINRGIKQEDALNSLIESTEERQFCLLAFRTYCFQGLFERDIKKINPNITHSEVVQLANELQSMGSKIINHKFDAEKEEILSRQILAIKYQSKTPKTRERKPGELRVTFDLKGDPRYTQTEEIFESPHQEKPEANECHTIQLLRDTLTRDDIRKINIAAFDAAQRRGGIPDQFEAPDFIASFSEDNALAIPQKSILKSSLPELEVYCPELSLIRIKFLNKQKQIFMKRQKSGVSPVINPTLIKETNIPDGVLL